MRYKLPKSWSMSSFKEVAEVVTGTTPSTSKPQYYGDSIPFVGPAELGDSTPITKASKYLSDEGGKVARLLPSDSVLVCCIGATIGKVGFAGTKLATNQQINALIFEPNYVVPRYAFYYCQTLKKLIQHQGASTTLPLLPKGRFQEIEIPFPPIAEQKRIAAILDKADAIRRKRKEAIALTEELLRSTFLDMFGDPVTNPKGWLVRKIGELTDVKTGRTPSRDDSGNYGGKINWVKTTEVRDSIIKETEEHLSEKGSAQMTIFPINTILVAMYGQGATRGRTSMLACESATNQACAAILPSDNYCSMYLWTLLRFSYERLRELGRGGNQPNLNLSMVKDFTIPLPPLEKQISFRSIALKLKDQSDKNTRSLCDQNDLFNSLLQRAFRGDL